MHAVPFFSVFAATLSVAVLIASPSVAQDHSMHRQTETKPFARPLQPASPLWFLAPELGSPPLYENLGTHGYRISTRDPMAQRYFDQGLRLAYGFNHAEAARAFREAQRLDPSCAMCFWGEALVLGPNINAPMDSAAAPAAYAAVQRARSLSAGAAEPERALIEALTVRYTAEAPADRGPLDVAYAQAMTAAAARFPQDAEIATLFAEALMDLSPWDYWQEGGHATKGRAGEAIAAIERAIALDPNHPGALHFYIHLVEASDNPGRAEPHADRLARLMPGAGHLVHMPSHIYFRVGRWLDSLEANRAAVLADEDYLTRVGAQGIYPGGYYPHNIHFLMTSAQMAGDGRTAVTAAEKLQKAVSDEAARAFAWVQPIKQAPYFAHAQYSEPATILSLPDPGENFPFVKAAWHYARGVAMAAQGDLAGAARERAAVGQLGAAPEVAGLAAAGLPAPAVLQVAGKVLEGRIAQARGDLAAVRVAFESATAIQEGLAYMEPPFWYYPVRQSLGAALLASGDLDGAEKAFRAALSRSPNNSWSLYGLREVMRARGDMAGVAELDGTLARAWVGEAAPLDLKRL